MNDQHVKGGVKGITGKLKEEIGHRTGNLGQEVKGIAERVAGKIHTALGDAKDAAKEKADEVLEKKPGRKLASLAVAALTALFVSGQSIAADTESKAEATTDTSKNPVTGTVTHTKKYKKRVKDAAGKTSEANVTDTTKEKTDGSFEHKKEIESNTDTNR